MACRASALHTAQRRSSRSCRQLSPPGNPSRRPAPSGARTPAGSDCRAAAQRGWSAILELALDGLHRKPPREGRLVVGGRGARVAGKAGAEVRMSPALFAARSERRNAREEKQRIPSPNPGQPRRRSPTGPSREQRTDRRRSWHASGKLDAAWAGAWRSAGCVPIATPPAD